MKPHGAVRAMNAATRSAPSSSLVSDTLVGPAAPHTSPVVGDRLTTRRKRRLHFDADRLRAA
ncbi:hypothetical protein D3218_14505 [Aureimonas flava]|uniref:Uncharacterized protein n=1 Tax=Aureimonas flava TaxID=2320271 RepID=A0A3A1WJ25_9HYPH|nr:hypothetical protein D3218_14505 [Aureimonas flava]